MESYTIGDDLCLVITLHSGRLQRGVSGAGEGAAAVTAWMKTVGSGVHAWDPPP